VSKLKQIAKKTRSGIIASKIYDNWQLKRRFKSGNPESLHGSTHSTIIKNTAASVDYINVQFDDYLQYSGLSVEDLQGKRIFELGFGDNVGVALKFVASGAAQVICLDKFYSKRDPAHQIEIYQALRETLQEQERNKFDEAISLESGIELNSTRIRCIYGVDVENATELDEKDDFDLVLSRGAIQDIYEPQDAFRAMDGILKPGGLMLHKIDLSDQGMFRDNGMNPLTFLTIKESIYRLMAIDSGKPNRKLTDYYRKVMLDLGYETTILITDIIGVGDVGKGNLHPHKPAIQLGTDYTETSLELIREIRPRLAPPFRGLSDDELLVDGIFIIARKPS
jgi:SAM-dependent methyltransferase